MGRIPLPPPRSYSAGGLSGSGSGRSRKGAKCQNSSRLSLLRSGNLRILWDCARLDPRPRIRGPRKPGCKRPSRSLLLAEWGRWGTQPSCRLGSSPRDSGASPRLFAGAGVCSAGPGAPQDRAAGEERGLPRAALSQTRGSGGRERRRERELKHQLKCQDDL